MKKLISISLLFGLFIISSNNIKVSNAKENASVKCAFPNFERAYERAKAVFVGEVIGVEKDGRKRVFEFKVTKYWKGIKETKVKVYVSENRRYQAPYKKGESFLVFAKDDNEGGLWDGRCSRSRNIEGFSPSLKEDLESLGEGKTCISLSKEKEVKDLEKKGE